MTAMNDEFIARLGRMISQARKQEFGWPNGIVDTEPDGWISLSPVAVDALNDALGGIESLLHH